MNARSAVAVAEAELRDEDLDDLGLTVQDYRTIYSTMRLAREFESRVETLFRQGRLVGAAYSGSGHEAISVGSSYTLASQDVLIPLHRDIGAHFIRGQTARRLMCQYMGRGNGPTRGRDGNMHCGDWNLKIVGMISHLGSNIPVAAGIALASKITKQNIVAMTHVGEGASNIGDFHEGLNLAAVRKLPLVLIIENNQHAYSTPTRHEYACEHLADRAAGYGIPGFVIDGTDVCEVYRVCKQAVERARAGDGPTLIEAKTTRLRGHAVHDDGWYVPKTIIEEGRRKDPVLRCETFLTTRGICTQEEIEEIKTQAVREIDDAVAFAEQSPYPKPEEAVDGVYAD